MPGYWVYLPRPTKCSDTTQLSIRLNLIGLYRPREAACRNPERTRRTS